MTQNKFSTNNNPLLAAVSSSDGETPVYLYADPTTHGLISGATTDSGATSVGNTPIDFKDGFDVSSGLAPDTTIWDLVNTDNHLITLGGNSFGSSYLRISLNPLIANSEVMLTSKQSFPFPIKAGYALSMSQRIVGQEVFAGLVGVNAANAVETTAQVANKPITGATATVTTNVATYTLTSHGLNGGDRIIISGCADARLNVGPVVVTIVDANTFTIPLVIANNTLSTVGGVVVFCDPLKFGSAVASNGFGHLYEITTPTNASWVMRRNGDKFRLINATVSTTVATQSNVNPYTDAFNSSNINDFYGKTEEIKYHSMANDGLATLTGILKYQQAVPNESKNYKLNFRARNLGNFSVPIARITAIAKVASTTATVTTDVPHGLVVGDFVQVYGVRDQTNFPALTASTVVGTVPNSTQFTVIIGSSSTTSSLDGTVYKTVGNVLAPGAITQAVQSVACTSGIMTVIGSAAWATPLPGEYFYLHGLTAAASAYEGAYKVARVSTTTLELYAPSVADFGSITTGGTAIRMTDVRIHFARALPYNRLLTEITGGAGNTTDINGAVPVVAVGTVSATQSGGVSTTMWNAAGWGGFLVNDVLSAALTATNTTAAVSPGSLVNVGTYAHSFNVVVTAVSGTNPTLDFSVEESMDNGTSWKRVYDFERITTTGTYESPVIQASSGTRYRYVQTVAGTTPSFTRAVNRIQYSMPGQLLRRFIDRSITLTSLNSTTPTYMVEGADTLQLTINVGAISTTAPAIVLEASETALAGDWYNIGPSLTAVASTTVTTNIGGTLPRFLRARVTTAGVGVTAGYVAIRAIQLGSSAPVVDVPNTALIPYSVRITSNTTTTPTATTAYVSSISISSEAAGTTSTVTIQDKSGTPLKLINGLPTTALTTTPTVVNFQTPVKMVGGIDIITAGAVAATADVWINYFQ